jgi:lysophospholipase L1-like esterase
VVRIADRFFVWVMLPFVGACGFHPGTAAIAPLDEVTASGRVFLLETEGLESPPIPQSGLFRAASFFAVDPDGDPTETATAFVVTIAADLIGSTRVRVSDSRSGERHELLGVAGDVPAMGDLDGAAFVAATDEARVALLGGAGVFVVRTIGSTEGTMWQRVGIVLPASFISNGLRVSVYRREFEGSPIHGAEIELAREFFHMAVVGDSIMWGNGLRREDKIHALVRSVIEQELNVRVITQQLAQNGATLIGEEADRPCTGGCWGEVPRTRTSIRTQFSSLIRPESIDLVLFSGCINDIGLSVLLDPFTEAATLTAFTELVCGTMMEDFLRQIRGAAPQARVVALGLYPIVSLQSDILGVEQLRLLFARNPVPFLDGLVDSLTLATSAFANTANGAIALAVESVNSSEAAAPMSAVAVPAFGPQNAVFAPESWLWNMIPENQALGGVDVGMELLPEDPIVRMRWEACLGQSASTGLIVCLYASVGHPRPAGARAYADAVVARLRELQLLPEV